MTAQVTEILHYQGKSLSLMTNPLTDYFIQADIHADFQGQSTACWRGYVGTWKILSDRLYLTKIKAIYKDGTDAKLEDFFPGFDKKVFAHWYTGVLRVPQGKLKSYVHMGYGSQYESDLFITVENGVVIGTRLQRNTEPTDSSEKSS